MRGNRSGVTSYSFVFLLRRSLFVALTFVLYKQPGLQVQLNIYLTLMYLIYLGYADCYELPV